MPTYELIIQVNTHLNLLILLEKVFGNKIMSAFYFNICL